LVTNEIAFVQPWTWVTLFLGTVLIERLFLVLDAQFPATGAEP